MKNEDNTAIGYLIEHLGRIGLNDSIIGHLTSTATEIQYQNNVILLNDFLKWLQQTHIEPYDHNHVFAYFHHLENLNKTI